MPGPTESTSPARQLPAIPLAIVGGLLLVNAVPFGTSMFTDTGTPYSVSSQTSLHLAHYVVWTACLVALGQLYPRIRGVGWAGILAAVGVCLDACARFAEAFFVPYLGREAPALLDSPPDAGLLVPLLGSGVVAMIGTATLAVVAWRRRVFPRPAAALLLVGAVIVPVLGPVSNVFIGTALLWAGVAARRPAPAASRATVAVTVH